MCGCGAYENYCCTYVIDPETWFAAETLMQSASPASTVRPMVPLPLPIAMPPLAAKFQPVAAVAPPNTPASLVAHTEPVPDVMATFVAAATTRLIEQM